MVTPENKNGATDAPRTPAEIVAALMEGNAFTSRSSGYSPSKVIESARNPELFQAWFEALPEDLTGLDLGPLYELAGDYNQKKALRDREANWKPVAPFGDAYTGPIGEDGVPLRRNKTKYEEAKEAARLAHLNRFKADFDAMQRTNGDVPHQLRDAADLLMRLALNADAGENEVCEWDGCQSPADVKATAAAIRLCLDALQEVESAACHIAYDTAERLKGDLKDVSQVTEKYE